MQKCDLLLRAGIIITQDAERRILKNAAIAVKDGYIAAIGQANELTLEWASEEEIDYSCDLLMPGLINAHTHAAMTFLRGKADDLPLLDWLTNTVFPVEARLTPEIVYLGSMLGYAEMLATGTTSCVDMYIYEDVVLNAADDAGIRCMGGEAIFNFPSAACADYKAALRQTEMLVEQYQDHDRIKVAVNPHSVYTTTPQILSDCRKLAYAKNLPLHIHLAETVTETAESIKMYGKRPVAHLDDLGLLEMPLLAAHIVDILPQEAGLLARHGVCGVHNPASNMKLASGAAPIELMRNLGLEIALGTDGPASNNQLNMFAEMRQAALMQKLVTQKPDALPAQAVLDMATRAGAKAMQKPGLGQLVPGAPADCIVLDLTKPNLQPMHNPVSQAVYAASGHECLMTMVGGEVLYQEGRFTRFEYADILDEMEQLQRFAG